MSYGKVAIRYANSFLESSIEKKNLDRAADDMSVILNAIESSSLLRRFLENPVVKTEQKKSVLREIFSKNVSADTINFIEFVVDKNRESALKDIAEKFLELKDEYSGVARVEIKSAFELSSEQKKMLEQRFESILNKKLLRIIRLMKKLSVVLLQKLKTQFMMHQLLISLSCCVSNY